MLNGTHLRAIAAELVLVFALAACGSAAQDAATYVSESPAGSARWVAIDGLPDWTALPPARDGYLRFVAEGKSNLRGIVATGGRPSAVRQAERAVTDALAPVVSAADAALAAAQVATGLTLVERACKEEVLTRDPVPGNTLCTAFALWEIRIADIVAPLQGGARSAAETALRAL